MLIKNQLPKILICDDDKNIHLALKSAFGKEYDLRSAYSGEEATIILRKNYTDVVLLDMEMGSGADGLATIPKLMEIQNDVKVIFFSGRTEFDLVRSAMKLGAFDYIPKDSGPDELRHAFSKALDNKNLKKKNSQSQHEIKSVTQKYTLIGNSPAMEKIRKQIERARLSPAPILICGETGTGKEVVARMLRKVLADGTLEPFVSVDSSTIQSSVAESVLFGYEKGAFTGAEKSTTGLFEESDGGCIYFDELGNMPLEIQNKLLRVIQEKEVLRIGSSKPISLDFRVICATNRDMDQMVTEGKFKDDLHQRINVLQIMIPPLRERVEDIPVLLEHFATILANGQERIQFLPETVEMIKAYPFPGNVRELSNLVLYLYSMSDEAMISPLDLPPKFQKTLKPNPEARTIQGNNAFLDEVNFYSAVELFERNYLGHYYKKLDSNVSKMAQELGMDRSYLHNKLKNFGIHQAKAK